MAKTKKQNGAFPLPGKRKRSFDDELPFVAPPPLPRRTKKQRLDFDVIDDCVRLLEPCSSTPFSVALEEDTDLAKEGESLRGDFSTDYEEVTSTLWKGPRPVPEMDAIDPQEFSHKTIPTDTGPQCPPSPMSPYQRGTRERQRQREIETLDEKHLTEGTFHVAERADHYAESFHELSKIAQGYFSDVLKVRDKETSTLYAVKRDNKDLCDRVGLNLLREARVLYVMAQRIAERTDREVTRHDFLHCVQYRDIWREGSTIFIQMEFCAGGNLRQYMESKSGLKIPEELIWKFLNDLAAGLRFLHSCDLTHCDLRPENIVLDEKHRNLKITDFGVTHSSGTHEVDGVSASDDGDGMYMCAQYLGGTIGPWCDIFSAGIIMLEFASGLKLPARGSLWRKLREDNIPDMQRSEKLEVMIQSMMLADHTKRPTAADLLSVRAEDVALIKSPTGVFPTVLL